MGIRLIFNQYHEYLYQVAFKASREPNKMIELDSRIMERKKNASAARKPKDTVRLLRVPYALYAAAVNDTFP